MSVGTGSASGHHGEILQGIFEDARGHPHRALVTLPYPALRSHATFLTSFSWPGAGAVSSSPGWTLKARTAAELTLSWLGAAELGGELTIRSQIPPALGLGSSTSDVTAAIRAVAAALEVEVRPAEVAALAVRAEVATDPLMFEHPAVLFAQREGVVLEDFGTSLPPLEVVGLDVSGGRGVDTLALPQVPYTMADLRHFALLRERLRCALERRDARRLGEVATASSWLNQRHLRKPLAELERTAVEAGSVGIQVAHSGSVAGLLFDAADPSCADRAQLARSLLAERFGCRCWRFSTASTVRERVPA